jgi:ribokinase
MPGGKGCNQAVAAARLGAGVTFVGRVGRDDFGARFLDLFAAEAIDARFVVRDDDEGTGIAMPVVFEDGTNSIIYAPRANSRLKPEDVEQAREYVEAADLLLLQLEVPPAASLAAARIARAAGIVVLLNPAPANELPIELLELADYVVPNEVEAAMLTGDSVGPPESHARRLLRPAARAVIVTLGERGCVAVTPEGERHFPAFEVVAVDTVGAGDAFCAGLGISIARRVPLEESIRFASAAAAITVTRPGSSSSLPTLAEVNAFLEQR